MRIEDYAEEWLPIIGYEDYYEISCYGKVRTLSRLKIGNNNTYYTKERILKTPLSGKGYPSVLLYRPFCHEKKCLIHILVGKHFIPNPENKPEINHLDGIKTNNYKHNLEWSTSKENINHAFDTGLNTKVKQNDKHRSKPVIQMDLSGTEICEFPSLKQVERSTGFKYPNIHHAIKNKIIRNGYLWKYKN